MSADTEPKTRQGAWKRAVPGLIALGSALVQIFWPLGGSKDGHTKAQPADVSPSSEPADGHPPADSTAGGTGGNSAGNSAIEPPTRGLWFEKHWRVLLFLLATPCALVFGWLASVPDTPTTPGGMLALEFPGTRSGALAALALLDQDNASGRRAVTKALWWDFGLILSYTVALWLATEWAVKRRFPRRATGEARPAPGMVDRFAIIAPIVAGLFDVLENVSLFALLESSNVLAGLLASATTTFACTKFTLLAFVVLYLGRSLVIIAWPESTRVSEPNRRLP